MLRRIEWRKNYRCNLLVVVLLLFHGQAISTPQQLTSEQLIQRVQQQTGANVISFSQLDHKNNTALVRLLYPSGEVKQQRIDTRSGEPMIKKINPAGS